VIVKEVLAKSILSKSKIFDYVVNPYIGCQHGCSFKCVMAHVDVYGCASYAVDIFKQ